MTRIVRNTVTGMFVNIDAILNESFEYDEPNQATIFNEVVDEMTDTDVIEYVTSGYSDPSMGIILEILPVKITIDIL